ncbi:MAG TPA: aspartate/glutamate racemase family protein, partial [Thermaerobacter sp.]
ATPARVDQDHVRIVIDNNPKIPDRTAYLRGEGPDPVPAMVAAIRGLAALGASLILIPCNTAHVYFDRLQAESPVPILHIMREVARALAAGRIPAPGGATGPGAPAAIPGPGNGVPSPWAETRVAGGAAAMANGLPGAGPELPLPAGGPVGLLATELTVQSGLYHRALAEVGLEVLVPEPEYQALVTRAIFGADGIKAGVYEPARQRLLAAGRHLVERGARVSSRDAPSCPWSCGPVTSASPGWTRRRSWPGPPWPGSWRRRRRRPGADRAASGGAVTLPGRKGPVPRGRPPAWRLVAWRPPSRPGIPLSHAPAWPRIPRRDPARDGRSKPQSGDPMGGWPRDASRLHR